MKSTAPDPRTPWYERDKDRLEWELKQFEARGLPATEKRGLEDGRFADQLVIETELAFRGGTVQVEVLFPFEYPDDGPTLFGPAGLLDRHQQPSGRNFCWAEDHDREWHPSMDAAGLVAEDLAWLLEDSEKGAEAVHAGEADMAEPLTGLIPAGDGVVVVPHPFLAEDLRKSKGTMLLVGDGQRFFLSRAAGLGIPDEALQGRYFRDQTTFDGYWLNLDPTPAPEVFLDNDALVELIEARAPKSFARLGTQLEDHPDLDSVSSWLGMTFLEEGPTRGEWRRNWLFARTTLSRSGAKEIDAPLRAQALTREERERRTPELAGLAESRIFLVGAGSLGSPVCLELTKAGVGHTDVADPDTFDVNNSVRHVLSPRFAGWNKANAVKAEAAQLNPFVTVKSFPLQVGSSALAAGLLDLLLAEASVVVDTTGSNAVARILQRRCAANEKPLVVAGLSAGAYGGEVAVFRPGEACFECFLLAQRDKEIPEPHAAPRAPGVTPIGCSHPAFPGAGFDATQLAALTARVAVQATEACDYPGLDFDWAVVNFRADPRWQAGRLAKHPECEKCS